MILAMEIYVGITFGAFCMVWRGGGNYRALRTYRVFRGREGQSTEAVFSCV